MGFTTFQLKLHWYLTIFVSIFFQSPIKAREWYSTIRVIHSQNDKLICYDLYLQEIAAIEKELNQFPSKWLDVVDRLEQPQRDTFRRQYSLSTQFYRSHGMDVHKRSTMEFLG